MVNFVDKIYAVQTGVGIPNSGTTNYTFSSYIAAIYKYSIVVGTSLAVIMLIYAGIKYISSGGNQTAINDAKDIVTNTILGYIILLLIYFILNALGISRT